MQIVFNETYKVNSYMVRKNEIVLDCFNQYNELNIIKLNTADCKVMNRLDKVFGDDESATVRFEKIPLFRSTADDINISEILEVTNDSGSVLEVEPSGEKLEIEVTNEY